MSRFKREVSQGDIIIKEGEAGHSMFFLTEGSVEVFMGGEGESGDKLAKLRKGSFFGEISFLTRKPRTASVKALTKCLLIEIDSIGDLQELSKGALIQLLKTLALRIARDDERLKEEKEKNRNLQKNIEFMSGKKM